MKDIYLYMIYASLKAGKEILKIYKSNNLNIDYKEDKTPVTLADKLANKIIKDILKIFKIPFVSEEDFNDDLNEKRLSFNAFFIIDPLDGTKEFIKKSDEFTVNIAFFKDKNLNFGVVLAPALNVLYFGGKNIGAYKIENVYDIFPFQKLNSFKNFRQIFYEAKEGKVIKNIKTFPTQHSYLLKVCTSRSHLDENTLNFIKKLKKDFEIQLEKIGSSLKFCLVAEGKAHLYPRFSPTMEWDTAAAQGVLEGAGGEVLTLDGKVLTYNKKNIKNPPFLALFNKSFFEKIKKYL